jgi:uncharacterized protein YegP (UPF0339 family)
MDGIRMSYYIYLDAKEYWRWYLLDGHNRRIAESPVGFHDKQDCHEAIALVKGSADLPVYEPPAL